MPCQWGADGGWLLAFIEKRLEASITCAAHGQAGAVSENGKPAILTVRLDAHYTFQIHDVRTMDAHESVRVQAGDGLPLEMFLPLIGKRHVIVLGLRVVKLANRNQRDPRAVFYYQAFQELLRGPCGSREFVRGGIFSPIRLFARSSAASKRSQPMGFSR